MRILFLSRWFPYPPDNGSKLRIYHLLSGLSKAHQVTLVSFYDPRQGTPLVNGLSSICETIYTIPWKEYQKSSLYAVLGLFSRMPRSLFDTFSPAMKYQVGQLLDSNNFDMVIASQIDTAIYAPYFGKTPAIFEEVEVGIFYENFAHASSWFGRSRAGLTWAKHRHFLKSTLDRFRLSTVVSAREADLIRSQVSPNVRIRILPNCVDVQSYADFKQEPEPFTMIFTGSFTYDPNYEAMVWFLQHVNPRVLKLAPGARVVITGNHAGKMLPRSDNVTLAGFVEDVRPYIRCAWCCLAPLQQGGGTRLKILEAMALGTPVVSTSKGAEGLDVKHGDHLLIADDPASFSNAVLMLFEDQELRQRLANNAYDLVNEKYNWTVVMPEFLGMVDEAIQ